MKPNTIIFGDSYSTFEGYIPQGYEIYYSQNPRPETDVTKVTETWWYQVTEEANLNLLLNNSWSGSTICYTGYENEDCSQSSSFIYRLRELIAQGFFRDNEIHRVFVFGGTNDSWADAPLGKAKYENFTEKELYCVLPAICYFFKLLRQTLPKAELYCLINSDLKSEITHTMLEVCQRYNLIPITFPVIDKRSDHPTIQGMHDIREQVLRTLQTKEDFL